MSLRPFFFLICFLSLTTTLLAQKTVRMKNEQCGTVMRLESLFENDPSLRTRFEQKRDAFNRMVQGTERNSYQRNNTVPNTGANRNPVISIPVVFHIVLPSPNQVTDAQVEAQLDTLNRDFFGSNGDSVKIPSWFKPLYGKSSIQFCLAQRTPDGELTNGIDRVTTSRSSFTFDDGVKHPSNGGVASWDPNKYFNIWVCTLSGGLLGYATFPDDASQPADQGVVIEYRSLPGGSFSGFNAGKTLTHETGHYFNLYHIWGDDGGACSGTDYVDDTPDQADATSGCYSGVHNDNCTPSGNGIMYQNYMDYSGDACLVMFTTGQVSRMESALSVYRSSLASSDGCQPPVLKNYNAQLRSIDQPSQRLCTPAFSPVITIRNRGSQTLTSLKITAWIDNGTATIYDWTGSLVQASSAVVALNNMVAPTGDHTLTVFLSDPNGNPDEETVNDTLRFAFEYNLPVDKVTEGFESSRFPPAGWDLINPDGLTTWQRISGFGKTGSACVMINNFDYEDIGQKDELRMPTVGIAAGTDSAFLSFQLAAATYTATNTTNNVWDTLEVLVSTDCGKTYTSLYKKWGASLVTRAATTTSFFTPTAAEWRKDSINLAPYIGNSNLLIAFRNTTGYENNVYLDDINLRTVIINPNLKASGFLVTPNPARSSIAVQFYPQPANLKGIVVLNALGQKVYEMNVQAGQGNNKYDIDLGGYAGGIYFVRAIFTDKVLMKRIIKL